MKVYLVYGGEWYEGKEVYHVASTKEKAESWIEKNNSSLEHCDYIEVGNCEVDGELE